MTSTFDASTPPGEPYANPAPMPTYGGAHHQYPPAEGAVEPIPDALADLAAALAERAAIEPITVEVPGVPVRLICHTDIASKQITAWQRRAMPPHLRKSAQVSPLDVDATQFAVATLVATCLHLEVQNADTKQWRPIVDSDGELLGLSDDALLRRFGALDTLTMLRKLFPREADLVRASQKVRDAAGWGEDVPTDEEDGNPTD